MPHGDDTNSPDAEQVAGHLREELLRGDRGEWMPGVDRLAADLGVSRKTAD